MKKNVSTNLPTFIRLVRESQAISQKELALKLGITPSAITQYEKHMASLSKEKLILMAPLLNINPEFVAAGIGNPFKQNDNQKIIHMYLNVNPEGHIVVTDIFKIITEYNDRAIFIFLKPHGLPDMNPIQVSRWQKKGLTDYALLAQDSDQNMFIFKKKDNAYFSSSELLNELSNLELTNDKVFSREEEFIDDDLYYHIQEWKVDRSKIEPFFKSIQIDDSRKFLFELLKRASLSMPSIPVNEHDALVREIEMAIEEGEGLNEIAALMPEIYLLLKKHFNTGREFGLFQESLERQKYEP